jgi:hypothetical protein
MKALPSLAGAAVDGVFAGEGRGTTPQAELRAVQARLRAVERGSRWLPAFAVVVLAAALAGAGLSRGGQAPSQGDVVEGQRFSLKDATGRERAWLGMDQGRPVLHFLNAKGQERAGLELADKGLILRVLGPRGRLRTGLSLEDQGVGLITFDRDGRPLAGENAVLNLPGGSVPAR